MLSELAQKGIVDFRAPEFLVFWEYFSDSSENLALLSMELIKAVMHLELGKKLISVTLDNLVTTLYTCLLFKKIQQERLRKTI